MNVVAARVHHSGIDGRKREPRVLMDGQRIDVAADRDHWRGAVPARHACHESGTGDVLDARDAQARERAAEQIGRALLVPRQLGMTVKVPPQSGELLW
jgi:protein involved in temperature-dependent protein secretion